MTNAEVLAARTSLGLTQGAFAQLLGVHPLTVSKWERGVLTPGPHEAAMISSFRTASAQEPGIGRTIANLIVGAGVAFAVYKLLDAAFRSTAAPQRE